MTDARDDLTEIEALARAATPGEWNGDWEVIEYGDGDSLVIHADPDTRVCFMATPGGSPGAMERIAAWAAHIAHMSPARTLRIVERLREAEKEREQREYCMCGERMSAHNVTSGHEPVSQYDYRLQQAEARAEALEVERDEARTGERNMSDHARLVAAEASDAFASMEDIAEFWDACGYPGNRATLTPAEQVSSIIHERDAAEARATALEVRVKELEEALKACRPGLSIAAEGDGQRVQGQGVSMQISITSLAEEQEKTREWLTVLEPHLDAVSCYASNMSKHPPNRVVLEIRTALKTKENP